MKIMIIQLIKDSSMKDCYGYSNAGVAYIDKFKKKDIIKACNQMCMWDIDKKEFDFFPILSDCSNKTGVMFNKNHEVQFTIAQIK